MFDPFASDSFECITDVCSITQANGRNRTPSTILTPAMGSGGELNGVVGRVQSSGNIPGQEFFDAVDRVLADAFEHVAQVRFGVDIVELRGADQAVDRGRALASGI